MTYLIFSKEIMASFLDSLSFISYKYIQNLFSHIFCVIDIYKYLSIFQDILK